MASPISNVFHPGFIDQTDRDPQRRRDDEAHRHHSRPHHAPPHEEPHREHTVEELEHKTTGLLIDVRA
jgi:hypothetical protein